MVSSIQHCLYNSYVLPFIDASERKWLGRPSACVLIPLFLLTVLASSELSDSSAGKVAPIGPAVSEAAICLLRFLVFHFFELPDSGIDKDCGADNAADDADDR